jgi:hypothetical protein
MAAVIVTTPQPTQGNVLITAAFTSLAETAVMVTRQEVDGTLVPVRTSLPVTGAGVFQELDNVGGMAYLFDTDPPLDQPLIYIATGLLTGATVTSGQVILPSSQDVWLKDPIKPAGNIRITLTPPSFRLPECVPGQGIFFAGMADQNFGTNTTNWSAISRQFPIPLTQVRAAPTSTLNLITRTFPDSDILLNLLSAGNALSLDTPPKYGYTRRYISVGDVVTSRVSRDFRRQWQTASLPYASCAIPGGLQYGTYGLRWKDQCQGRYSSIADVTAAGITWNNVMQGATGPQ